MTHHSCFHILILRHSHSQTLLTFKLSNPNSLSNTQISYSHSNEDAQSLSLSSLSLSYSHSNRDSLFDSHIEFSFWFRFKDCLFHYVALQHTLSIRFNSWFTYNYIHPFSRLSCQDSIFLFDSVYSIVFLSCSSITIIHCWSLMVSLSSFVPRYILFKYSLLNAKKVWSLKVETVFFYIFIYLFLIASFIYKKRLFYVFVCVLVLNTFVGGCSLTICLYFVRFS